MLQKFSMFDRNLLYQTFVVEFCNIRIAKPKFPHLSNELSGESFGLVFKEPLRFCRRVSEIENVKNYSDFKYAANILYV